MRNAQDTYPVQYKIAPGHYLPHKKETQPPNITPNPELTTTLLIFLSSVTAEQTARVVCKNHPIPPLWLDTNTGLKKTLPDRPLAADSVGSQYCPNHHWSIFLNEDAFIASSTSFYPKRNPKRGWASLPAWTRRWDDGEKTPGRQWWKVEVGICRLRNKWRVNGVTALAMSPVREWSESPVKYESDLGSCCLARSAG